MCLLHHKYCTFAKLTLKMIGATTTTIIVCFAIGRSLRLAKASIIA